jgi:hypothetical protein
MRQTSRRNGAAHHEPPANAVRIRNACYDIDVVELLRRAIAESAPYPRAALPPRQWGPFEQDRLLARSIARAKFVTLESDNHVVLAGGLAQAHQRDRGLPDRGFP